MADKALSSAIEQWAYSDRSPSCNVLKKNSREIGFVSLAAGFYSQGDPCAWCRFTCLDAEPAARDEKPKSPDDVDNAQDANSRLDVGEKRSFFGAAVQNVDLSRWSVVWRQMCVSALRVPLSVMQQKWRAVASTVIGLTCGKYLAKQDFTVTLDRERISEAKGPSRIWLFSDLDAVA